MAIPADHYRIASHTAAIFGGTKPSVVRCWDDQKVTPIDIVSSLNSPLTGTTSVGTIGLLDHPIGLTAEGKPLRVELVGACSSSVHLFPNILATCAFFVIQQHPPCSPGYLFPDIVAMYAPASNLRHILLVSPFLWARSFGTVDLSDRTVAWLQAVPISEAERRFILQNGCDAMETLFEESEIDLFALNRPSVL